ncbi:PepSY domain-containing protein [Aestuariibacter sp. AA17]|uniref:PepSY domain-containing protein n=1 Tax=Fluctibacter corallii TaxID=2984329 RepID=A0ABT3AAM0_9ALTE|nr:PepSY-associated TM helix domain-containing protein [Aestuariibacter sp. AA17]MCV2885673.1 PepSY domain-containing protein [Aestuariibacter sp. AA17]
MKKSAFKIHSWLALFALIPLLVISLTGSILVYKQEIDEWLMPDKAMLSGVSGERLDLDAFLDRIHEQLPEFEVATIEMFFDGVESDRVYVIKKGTFDFHKVYANPYTGEVLSEPVGLHSYLTDWLLELHYTFLVGDAGLLIAAFFSLILITLGVTGLIMYSNFYKHFFTFRTGRALAVLFSDVHKFIGILASPVLLILGITGAYWNIAGYLHETSEEHASHADFVLTERMYNHSLSLQSLIEKATDTVDGLAPTYVSLAYEPDENIRVFGSVPTGNPLYSQYSSGASFDPQTGDMITSWDIRELGFVSKLLDSFRELHFGTFGGELSKFLWCVLGAAPLLLSVTGVYMWSNRRNKRKSSKKRRAEMHNSSIAVNG